MSELHDRSVPEVLTSIVGNVQEICRSELRLAKTELKEELSAAMKPVAAFGAGLLLAGYAVGLGLLALVFGLATVLPTWGAALLVAVVTAAVGAFLIARGRKGLMQVQAIPQATIASLKENLRWAKQAK